MLRILAIILFLSACSTIKAPSNYTFKIIKTRNFDIASWQKITAPNQPYKIYIEGDGYAFNSHGQPTKDPTPRGTLVRELAFGDNSPNVIYLARPCQYIKSPICSQRHWTTARFSPEIINAEYEAIKQIAANTPIVLIGFSGGAQIAGLVATAKIPLNICQIVTIAGNLDHLAWTQHHELPPLNESLNLESYHQQFNKIPQIHYVGSDDAIIPPHLVKGFVTNNAKVITVDGASHNSGWQKAFREIWQIQCHTPQ